MSDRHSPSACELIVEISKPLFYGLIALSPAILLGGSSTPNWLLSLIATVHPALAIWLVIRWINGRDGRWHDRPQRPLDVSPDSGRLDTFG